MPDYYIVRQPTFPGMQFFPQSPGFPGGGPGFPGGGPGFPGGGPGFPGGGPGFPGGGPGFPGGGPGFPGGGPGFPGGGPGFPGGGAGSGPPSGPPPTFTPSMASAQHSVGAFAINPGAIRPCRFRYVYIWLRNGQQFWAWLVFVGRDSISGWRWTGFRWVFFGVDLNRIAAFQCF